MKENIYARGYVLGRCLNSALNVKSDFVSLPDGRGIERAAETPSPPSILPRRLPPHLVRTPNGSSGLAQSPTQRLILMAPGQELSTTALIRRSRPMPCA